MFGVKDFGVRGINCILASLKCLVFFVLCYARTVSFRTQSKNLLFIGTYNKKKNSDDMVCFLRVVVSAVRTTDYIQGVAIRHVSAALRCKWSPWIMYSILGQLFYHHIRYKAINRYFQPLSIYINSQRSTLIAKAVVCPIIIIINIPWTIIILKWKKPMW